ncbi:MAG: hypothetical protein KGN79_05800 [Acidobacteriota bacterium]|nr:hypothetical protein [Acidobacteriota bacterium]
MEILERYLQAVRKFLPGNRQDDIIAELRANLEAQIEDEERECGRALSKAELEELLKKMGSPVFVAMHYQPQRYVIGPKFFPMYWYVLRLAMMWSLLVFAIVNAVQIGAGQMGQHVATAIAQALFQAPFTLLTVAAWITLAFAGIEYVAEHYPNVWKSNVWLGGNWSVDSLPALEKHIAPGGVRRSYAKAVAEVVFGFIFLAWLLLVPKYPIVMFGPGVIAINALPYTLAQSWWTFYWIIIVINSMQLAWNCIDLLRDSWQRVNPLQHIVAKSLSVVAFAVMLATSNRVYVVLKNPVADLAKYGDTLDGINRGVHLGLSLLVAIAALQLAWEIVKSVRDRQNA